MAEVDKKYNDICKKLGFIPSEYQPKSTTSEDDSKENPFSVLDADEKMYLYKNGYLTKKTVSA